MIMDFDSDFFGQDLGFFAGFGSDLDLRSRQVPDLDLDFFGQDLGFFAGFGSDLDLRSPLCPLNRSGTIGFWGIFLA